MTENNKNDTNNNKLKVGKNAYQREVSFQGKKHLVFLHGLEVGHVIKQQEGLLQGISYVPSLALLKIPNKRIHREGRSDQHQRGVPSLNLGAMITPPLSNESFD